MRSIVIAMVLAALASPLAAQRIDSPYRFVDTTQQLGVFAGYVFTDPGSLDLGPESAAAFGARYGIRVTGPFSIEGSAMVLPTSRLVRDTAVSAGGTDTTHTTVGEADMTLAAVYADLRFDVTGPRTWNGLMPYVVFGVGAAFPISNEDAADEDLPSGDRYRFGTRLVGDLGLGVEWFPLERWTVRLDARDFLWKIEVPQGLRTLDTPEDEWVQNFMLSAGVSFRF